MQPVQGPNRGGEWSCSGRSRGRLQPQRCSEKWRSRHRGARRRCGQTHVHEQNEARKSPRRLALVEPTDMRGQQQGSSSTAPAPAAKGQKQRPACASASGSSSATEIRTGCCVPSAAVFETLATNGRPGRAASSASSRLAGLRSGSPLLRAKPRASLAALLPVSHPGLGVRGKRLCCASGGRVLRETSAPGPPPASLPVARSASWSPPVSAVGRCAFCVGVANSGGSGDARGITPESVHAQRRARWRWTALCSRAGERPAAAVHAARQNRSTLSGARPRSDTRPGSCQLACAGAGAGAGPRSTADMTGGAPADTSCIHERSGGTSCVYPPI